MKLWPKFKIKDLFHYGWMSAISSCFLSICYFCFSCTVKMTLFTLLEPIRLTMLFFKYCFCLSNLCNPPACHHHHDLHYDRETHPKVCINHMLALLHHYFNLLCGLCCMEVLGELDTVSEMNLFYMLSNRMDRILKVK